METPLYYGSAIRGNADGLYLKAVTHNWDLVMASAPKGLESAFNDLIEQGNLLNVHCQSVSLPNTNVSTVEGNVRGVRFHQIQTRASTQIQTNLVFYEEHSYPIYRFFELWKTTTVSRYHAAQYPTVRIPRGVSIVLNDTLRENKVLEYELYDTYCSSAQISDPGASGVLQTVTATLVSSNYGVVAYADGGVVSFSSGYDSGYLGTDNNWVSANGESRKGD